MPTLPDRTLNIRFLTFDKSDFLIDLRETIKGKKYLQITQTIHEGGLDRRSILKINPNVLNTLVSTLLELNGQEEEASAIPKDQYGQEMEKLKSAYLKGTTLESLRLQFPKYSVEEMEAMLRASGIAIVNQTYIPPKKRYFRRRK